MQAAHHPIISERPDRSWVVECPQCRRDMHADVPIGIGLPLRDKETAERLRDNHSGRALRMIAS
jgi:hypothetical protein